MVRFLSILALAAMSTPAIAGPTISTQGPGDGGASAPGAGANFVLDCRINGRAERFAIAGTVLLDRPGSVIMLDTGVYSVITDRGTVLLTSDSAQIADGPDAGKWDCVEAAAGSPAGDPGAMAALQQQLATARAALEATQGDLMTTIMERDAAQTAVAAAETRTNAALEEIEVLRSELAASLHVEETAQAALIRAEDDLADALERIEAGEAERAALETALAAARAEADMTEADMDDAAPDADVTSEAATDQGAEVMFDADAALATLEAAEISDIARAALMAAVEQARDNPDMVAEVMARLQNALGQ